MTNEQRAALTPLLGLIRMVISGIAGPGAERALEHLDAAVTVLEDEELERGYWS